MSSAEQSPLAVAALADPASGDWLRLTTRNLGEGVYDKVQAFEPLDYPAGHEAARFLREEALGNASAVTHVLVGPERIEGFVTTTYTTVELTRRVKRALGLRRLREPVSAFYVLWVAKHRDSTVHGIELVGWAYFLGLEAAERGGLPVLVLDPADEKVERMWKEPPYGFEESEEPKKAGVARKLWTPLELDGD